MKLKLTNNVALGVPDNEAAAQHYASIGFEIGQRGDEWIEVTNGPMKFYLVEDEDRVPMFAFDVEDVRAALGELEDRGWRKIGEAKGEVYVQDPHGYRFCLSPK